MEISLLIEEFIKNYGKVSIFIIVALEYANASLPSELVLPLVGILALIKNKYPKTKKSIKASYRWLAKYEKISVMLSRLVPLARTFISIVAGVTKMNVVEFVVYSGIGIAIWNTIPIFIGYILENNMSLISTILKNYSNVLIVILGVVFVGYIIYTHKNHKVKN
ncbi:VTT domain-containing protein [Romboutsia sedimentorum]|uniref:VTT domain-containing protein n=1 Tax=Romboutsia sedimentorum TaxID=1368474 RepID=A0ABT7EA44_9FIRM|nr:VTT domain-containing protein [Romboutsia sedimentorum]MDK2562943.1 VTT domain-containing protein [Romboutsia sedimentorum]